MNNEGIRAALEEWRFSRSAAELEHGPISTWDTQYVTDMSRMFKYQSDFNEDISRWNAANVTTMEGMFSGASSFNQPLGQ
jgi:surface protein